MIDVADFADDDKLGKGKEMVDKLTNLIAIFENPALDFSKNRAGGDDILGDAFEYLMSLRLENQANLILKEKKKPKNFLQIKNLTKVQQVALVEIFKVIEEFQARIRISFTRSL